MRLSVLQNQWLIIAMAGGLGLVILTWLTFLAVGRPRTGPDSPGTREEKGSASRWFFSFVPWVLIVTCVLLMTFGLVVVISKAFHPPNW